MSNDQIASAHSHDEHPPIPPVIKDQMNQPDRLDTDLSTNLAALRIEQPKTTPPTLQIHKPNSTPAKYQPPQPSIPTATAYETISSTDSDEEIPSPISRPEEWDSDESHGSNGGYHYMTRHEVRLYTEKRLRERADPIQAHLEFIHQAFSNVDPKFTIFAFGGTILADQIKCEDLRLRVWQPSATPSRQGGNVKGRGELGLGDGTADVNGIVTSQTGGSGCQSRATEE